VAILIGRTILMEHLW